MYISEITILFHKIGLHYMLTGGITCFNPFTTEARLYVLNAIAIA